MSGVALVQLTDKELALVIEWGTWVKDWTDEDVALFKKFSSFYGQVSCSVKV